MYYSVFLVLAIAQCSPHMRIFFDDKESRIHWSDKSSKSIEQPVLKPSVKLYTESSEKDPCQGVWCKPGRVCVAKKTGDATCHCMAPRQCEVHRTPHSVCGSDGVLYHSHCDLHRTACTTRRHISFDKTGNLCKTGKVIKTLELGTDQVILPMSLKKQTKKNKSLNKHNHVHSKSMGRKHHSKSDKHNQKKAEISVKHADQEIKKEHKNRKSIDNDGSKIKHGDVMSKKEYKKSKLHLVDKKGIQKYNTKQKIQDIKKHTHSLHKNKDIKKQHYYKEKKDRERKNYMEKQNKYDKNPKGHDKTILVKDEITKHSQDPNKPRTKQSPNQNKNKQNKRPETFDQYFHRMAKKVWSDYRERHKEEKHSEKLRNKSETSTSLSMSGHDNVTTKLTVNKDGQHNLIHREDNVTTKLHDVTTQAVTTIDQGDVKDCTSRDFSKFKKNLLMYHCKRINVDCNDKPFLGNVMFTYYDQDLDGFLVRSELDYIHKRDRLDKVSGGKCMLSDMLFFDDKAPPRGKISRNEFFQACKISEVHLDPALTLTRYVATQGVNNAVEMQCNIKGASDIVWKRNSVDIYHLTDPDIKLLSDHSLFLSSVGVHHTGNYTCQQRDDNTVQTHVLKVQVAPKVQVIPKTRYYGSGSDVTIKCHASGLPTPDVTWKVNEDDVPSDPKGEHFIRTRHNRTLQIESARYKQDTGAYKCLATNWAGKGHDISSVFIGPDHKQTENKAYELFAVFHSDGYQIYEPNRCVMYHSVMSQFSLIKLVPTDMALKTLCKADTPCVWGSAVNVRNKCIYVSQPTLNRLVVINVQDRMNPAEFIKTDHAPSRLQYIDHLDELWLLSGADNTSQVIQVVRKASQSIMHHPVHTQPIGDHYDQVLDLFIAPKFDMEHKLQHGYVSHPGQTNLHKMAISTMKYTKSVSLTEQHCIPEKVSFVPIGGAVIVTCLNSSKHLVMDYITDSVRTVLDIGGKLYVSPDSRHLVFMDHQNFVIRVYTVLDNGTYEKALQLTSPVETNTLAFFPSSTGLSYDLYAGTASGRDALFIETSTGRMELLTGITQGQDSGPAPHTSMVSGGVFTDYVLATGAQSLVLIHGRTHHSQCELPHIKNGNVVVWFETH